MKTKKFFKILLMVIIISFAVYQVFTFFYQPLTTVSALYFSTDKGIEFSGTVVRNEVLIENNNSGVIHYNVSNSDKIAKGSSIADIYDSTADSENYSKLEQLEEKLAFLNNFALYNGDITELTVISRKIDDKIAEINKKSITGKYASHDDDTQLLALLGSKQNAVEGTGNIDGMVSSLKSQIDTLKATLKPKSSDIKAPESGYFLSEADGYETVLTPDRIENITAQDIEGLKPAEVSKTTIGKVVTDFKWYLLTILDSDQALKLKENQNYNIVLSQYFNSQIELTLKKLRPSDNSDKILAVFYCENTNGVFSSLRDIDGNIILESYTGIKVPNSAVRKLDDRLGVYTVSGGVVRFKDIKVLYSENDFSICEIDENGRDSSLRLYDEIIDKGKNLYDGKTIS